MAIGDVSGRGFQAAALMGQLRSGLRAYAMDRGSPSEVVERLSQLLRQLEPGRNATLLYLLLDPQEGSLLLAGAGHPPPLVPRRRRAAAPSSSCRARCRSARSATPSYEEVEAQLEPGRLARALHRRRGRAPRRAAGRGTRAAAGSGRRGRTASPWRMCDAIVAARCSRTARPATTRHCSWRGHCRSSDPLELQPPADVDTIPTLRRVLGTLAPRGRGVDAARSRRSPLRARRPAPTPSSTPTRPGPAALEVTATVDRGARRADLRARLRELASAAGQPPRPRDGPDEGPDGRRGRGLGRRTARRSGSPGGWRARPHERPPGAPSLPIAARCRWPISAASSTPPRP